MLPELLEDTTTVLSDEEEEDESSGSGMGVPQKQKDGTKRMLGQKPSMKSEKSNPEQIPVLTQSHSHPKQEGSPESELLTDVPEAVVPGSVVAAEEDAEVAVGVKGHFSNLPCVAGPWKEPGVVECPNMTETTSEVGSPSWAEVMGTDEKVPGI